MLRSKIWLVAVLLVGLWTMPTFAQTNTLEPLGIALEGYDYPYPVKFFPLKIEGQDLRMAYMM